MPKVQHQPEMLIPLGRPLLFERDEYTSIAPRVKRSTGDERAILITTILLPSIFLFVFVPFFIFTYRAWKRERINERNKKRGETKEKGNGRFEKAELSSGSSVLRYELDGPSEAQELPERKGGLPHEMLGATAFPQELPGDLLEMPAEVYKKS